MGTWAIHSFGNDDAAELLAALTEGNDLGPVRDAVARVVESDGYLEAPEAQQCLAACEVIAAALSRPGAVAQAEEELVAWIAKVRPQPDSTVTLRAVNAIDRILASDSELCELWEESDDFADWKTDVMSLRGRLQG
jgi:hypothetical protein